MNGKQGLGGSGCCSRASDSKALWLRALTASCLLLLSACGGGGGGDATPTQTADAPAIGTTGGTASEASGAQVIVPAGAFESATTVRVAKDSTGAPALPEGLVPAGSMYVVTPHGGNFALPVEVRIPLPTVNLQDNQEIKLAKAQPGGSWEILRESEARDGNLVAQVQSFSYFVVVVVTYPLPLPAAQPFAVLSQSFDIPGQDPFNVIGAATVTLSVTTNSGQLPANCGNGFLTLVTGPQATSGFDQGDRIPLGGGTFVRTVPEGAKLYFMVVNLNCPGTAPYAQLLARAYAARRDSATFPNITLIQLPSGLDVVEGRPARLEATLSGGAAKVQPGSVSWTVPTESDRAVIEWQRSDDGGASWRVVATSFQNEAMPKPNNATQLWRNWVVGHGFVAAASDQSALLRLHACYIPPTGAAAPCLTSPAARVNVLQQSALPSFTTVPRSMLIRTGQTASLSANAAGAPAPALQWQTRAANATGAWSNVSAGSGASTGDYTTVALTAADNGTQFRVIASNAVGTAESPPVTVSVSDLDVAPTITSQPASLSVATGSDAALAVAARGTEALSYEWRFNGVVIAGANAPLLRLAAVGAGQAGSYTVTVSNTAGIATSNVATLIVTPGAAAAVAPSIVTQPVSVLANAGNTATFAVGVAGTAPFSYQWLKDGQAIAGATAAYYSLPAAAVGDAATYAVRVGNAVNSVTSFNVTLTVNASVQPTAVAITTQPAPQVQPAGGGATFAVAATGSGPLSYQWSKDGLPIAGQTTAVLTIAALTSGDAGSYSVAVGNALGTVNSNAAVLTLLGMPAITAQPQAVAQTAGGTATFSVTASGQGLRYLWLRNGVPAAGGTAAQLVTPALTQGDSGAVYSVIVFNAAGGVASSTAVLTVNPVVVSASVLAGNIGSRGYVDGSGSAARFNSPVALALDAAGNAYVREPCLIRKVTPAGLVSTLAGVAGDCNIADGPPGTARVGGGTGIAVDAAGNVYFSDGLGAIRKSTPAGVLSTVAGDALLAGYADGSGASARFNQPHGLAIDAAGNLYVADTNNAAIRVVTQGGAVSTLARGQAAGGYTVVDGAVGVATFSTVVGLIVDSAGTVYVADEGTNSIRRIAGGQVSTLAGSSDNNNGSAGAVDGVGAAARFSSPQQLAVDANGNVYVADMGNAAVRKITPAGSVSTALGVLGDYRMLPGATPPRITAPAGLALAGTGQLLVTSLDAHVVLRATVP